MNTKFHTAQALLDIATAELEQAQEDLQAANDDVARAAASARIEAAQAEIAIHDSALDESFIEIGFAPVKPAPAMTVAHDVECVFGADLV